MMTERKEKCCRYLEETEALLEEFENAVLQLSNDEMIEAADPNRENADYARNRYEEVRDKVLKIMREGWKDTEGSTDD